MKPLFSKLQVIFLHLLVHLSWLLPPCLSDQRYANCAPMEYRCGDVSINVSYPFRVDGRNDYCGHSGYFLTCTDNRSLTIKIAADIYQVKAVDYANHLISLVDRRFLAASTSYGDVCIMPLANMTVDFSLYEYSDRDVNLTFYSNCNASSLATDAFFRVDCGSEAYYSFDNASPYARAENCSWTTFSAVEAAAANSLGKGELGLGDALCGGFSLKWMAGREWCSNCTLSGGLCGYNIASPVDHTCICPEGLVIGKCSSGANFGKKNIIIGVILGTAVFLLAVIFLYQCLKRKFHYSIFLKKKTKSSRAIKDFLESYGALTPKTYSYSELKRITKSFSDKLGQGGYGTVFKGTLSDGHQVAVKVLSESKGNGEEFINEVASIGRTSHVNIVSLLGFCLEGTKRALVYDFMPNGSLEKYICGEKSDSMRSLSWETLYNIAIGIARGLKYLHRGCNTRIVHFDIKPHNILLDEDFCPKISDFGLAKLCPHKESILSMVGARGTIGYIAPEVFSRNFGVVSSKSDVYSYGMMVLEMAGGRKKSSTMVNKNSEFYFPHWIYEHLDKHSTLQDWGTTAETEEIARKMILVGLWCIQTMPTNRPSIVRVVEMLSGSITDLLMPPKPYLSSPIISALGSKATSTS